MKQLDPSFTPDEPALLDSVLRLVQSASPDDHHLPLPNSLPEFGLGEDAVLAALAGPVLGKAAKLDAPTSFGHMDPPTPWVTWATTLWNARLNQNLLHSATAPAAQAIESAAVDWLSPYFGMAGGHMVPGSTIANLTALWAARETRAVEEVVAADSAHISVAKAASLLGLRYRALPSDRTGRLLAEGATGLERACLVLTAGTTGTGAIDPLALAGSAAWTHIDAAWAGPLRMSPAHAPLLTGIEQADSVSVSAHKWLFQPKESGLILFRDVEPAHSALSFAGPYLATPNIGLLGSHGAAAVPLVALLWAWGRTGLAVRLNRCMTMAGRFAQFVAGQPSLELLESPVTGVVVWRHREKGTTALHHALPRGLASLVSIEGEPWLRCVAANPMVDVDVVMGAVSDAL